MPKICAIKPYHSRYKVQSDIVNSFLNKKYTVFSVSIVGVVGFTISLGLYEFLL